MIQEGRGHSTERDGGWQGTPVFPGGPELFAGCRVWGYCRKCTPRLRFPAPRSLGKMHTPSSKLIQQTLIESQTRATGVTSELGSAQAGADFSLHAGVHALTWPSKGQLAALAKTACAGESPPGPSASCLPSPHVALPALPAHHLHVEWPRESTRGFFHQRARATCPAWAAADSQNGPGSRPPVPPGQVPVARPMKEHACLSSLPPAMPWFHRPRPCSLLSAPTCQLVHSGVGLHSSAHPPHSPF